MGIFLNCFISFEQLNCRVCISIGGLHVHFNELMSFACTTDLEGLSETALEFLQTRVKYSFFGFLVLQTRAKYVLFGFMALQTLV